MEPIASDVTSDSSTEMQGDNTTDSPNVETNAAPEPLSAKRLQSRLEKLWTAESDSQPEAGTEPDGDEQSEPVDGAEKKAGRVQAKDEKKADDNGEAVPMKAFLARVGKETDKRKAAEDRAAKSDLAAAKANEALQIAAQVIQRYKRAAAAGKPLDARDEQLLDYELRSLAQQASQRLDVEHAQQFEKATAQQRAIEERAEMTERYANELAVAQQQHPMVHRSALIAEMRKPENKDRGFLVVARELEAQLLEAAKARIVKERPPHPKTVRAKPGGGPVAGRTDLSAKGLLGKLNEIRQRNQ
jgi:hypothetical protein